MNDAFLSLFSRGETWGKCHLQRMCSVAPCGYRRPFAGTSRFKVQEKSACDRSQYRYRYQHRYRRYTVVSPRSHLDPANWRLRSKPASIQAIPVHTLCLNQLKDSCYRYQYRSRCQHIVDISTCLPLEPSLLRVLMEVNINTDINISIDTVNTSTRLHLETGWPFLLSISISTSMPASISSMPILVHVCPFKLSEWEFWSIKIDIDINIDTIDIISACLPLDRAAR